MQSSQQQRLGAGRGLARLGLGALLAAAVLTGSVPARPAAADNHAPPAVERTHTPGSHVTLPQAMQPPAVPTNFRGQRDHGLGNTVVLQWSAVADADYYALTAHSASNPSTALGVGSGAEDIAKTATSFVVTGDAALVSGNVVYSLVACKVPHNCSAAATVTVAGNS